MRLGYGGLNLIHARAPAHQRFLDQRPALGNGLAVPQRPVLIGERNEFAIGINARMPAGVL